MDPIPCPQCGETHDVGDLEPSFRRPDPFVAIPPAERDYRTLDGNDSCAVRDADGANPRYFLRVLLPVEVFGQERPCSWGIWVEVSEEHWRRARELWRDPDQHTEPPFGGVLANTCPGYRETEGLPGLVQLVGPDTIPTFSFLDGVSHPLAEEQRTGVEPARVLDWLVPWIHPEGAL